MSQARITLRIIAEKAGVSLNTVSLALRGSPRLKAETCRRLQALAREMGYAPNPVLAAGMAQLTRREAAEIGGALLGVHFEGFPGLRSWAASRLILDGMVARAGEFGYRVEWAQLTDEATKRRLLRLLRARGIPGVIVFGAAWPEVEGLLGDVITGWPTVRAGSPLKTHAIHFCESDHFRGTRLAFRKARERGAKRVGLVVQRSFDQSRSGATAGGFASCQLEDLKKDRVDPLLDWEEGGFEALLQKWWRRWQPDAILTNQKEYSLAQWVAWNPTDKAVDFIQLGHTEETREWPGVSYPGENVGRSAVDMVVAQIHRGERGSPRYQKCSLSEGGWVDGDSACTASKKSAAPSSAFPQGMG